MPKTSYIMIQLSNNSTSSELQAFVEESDEQAHRRFLCRANDSGYQYWPTSLNKSPLLQQQRVQHSNIIDFDMSKFNLIGSGLQRTHEESTSSTSITCSNSASTRRQTN